MSLSFIKLLIYFIEVANLSFFCKGLKSTGQGTLWSSITPRTFQSTRGRINYARTILYSSINNNPTKAEKTKASLRILIDQSWLGVKEALQTTLNSENSTVNCLEDLKSITSLLILATIRKSADEFESSKATLEWMLNKADVDGDGQLTYSEWYDWLLNSRFMKNDSSYTPFPRGKVTKYDISADSFLKSDDPMLSRLALVLGHAISSLRIMARMTVDPTSLIASYVAGGMIAGELDENVGRSMLSRLTPEARNLVLQGLSLEATPIATLQQRKDYRSANPIAYRKSSFFLPYPQSNNNEEGSLLTEALESTELKQQAKKKAQEVIMTIDLSAVPVRQAPAIFDEEKETSELTPVAPSLSNKKGSYAENEDDAAAAADDDDDDDDDDDSQVTSMGTVTKVEARLTFSPEKSTSSSSVDEIQPISDLIQKQEGNDDVSEDRFLIEPEELQRFSFMIESTAEVHNSLEDLEDAQASYMREVLLEQSKTFGSLQKTVMGLAMSLRAARLQNIIPSNQSRSWRQQIALESLQLWSPISYQLELASHIQELEIHSYIHLFPNSFSSFLSWYSLFRPIAKKLVESFRQSFTSIAQSDPILCAICSQVILQSRLKTPPSAFKKMVRNVKLREELYDLLGVRIITVPRETHVQPSLSDDDDDDDDGDDSLKGKESADGFGDLENIFFNGDSKDSRSSTATVNDKSDDGDSHTTNPNKSNAEYDTIVQIRQILSRLSEWEEDTSRSKDYVKYPKPSGYQSMHLFLVHKKTGINIEVQIRSERMHWVAEYGPASHNNYKALLLPSSSSSIP